MKYAISFWGRMYCYKVKVEFIATEWWRYQFLPLSVGKAGTSCKVLFTGARRSLIDGCNWDPGLESFNDAFGWPQERESLVAGRVLLKLALSGRLTLETAIGDVALSTFVLVPLTLSA